MDQLLQNFFQMIASAREKLIHEAAIDHDDHQRQPKSHNRVDQQKYKLNKGAEMESPMLFFVIGKLLSPRNEKIFQAEAEYRRNISVNDQGKMVATAEMRNIKQRRPEEANEKDTGQLGNVHQNTSVVGGLALVNKAVIKEDILLFEGVVQINHTQRFKEKGQIIQRHLCQNIVAGQGNGQRISKKGQGYKNFDPSHVKPLCGEHRLFGAWVAVKEMTEQQNAASRKQYRQLGQEKNIKALESRSGYKTQMLCLDRQRNKVEYTVAQCDYRCKQNTPLIYFGTSGIDPLIIKSVIFHEDTSNQGLWSENIHQIAVSFLRGLDYSIIRGGCQDKTDKSKEMFQMLIIRKTIRR